MKKILSVFTLLWVLQTPGFAQDFLVGFEDIPIMDGLIAANEPNVAFDSPLGRIVEVYATGNVTRAETTDFYDETLPSLGWLKSGDTIYTRDNERFALDFFGQDGNLTIRFTLAPN